MDDRAPTRLARRLGTADAVVVGLGSMIGAGVFAAFAPAARAAGSGLLIGLVIAGVVAYCNATSSARLAAVYPESGGAYVYGRERLGPLWGFLAGWCFVVGKIASCAAMAMTFAGYAAPTLARPLAVGAVAALTVLNGFGVQKTALATRVIVATVLAAIAAAIAFVWLGGGADLARVAPAADASAYGVLQSAGFLFFAFAGYARIATLAEEILDPARVIPRAIPIALGVALVVYATVAVTLLAGAGAPALAHSTAPFATAIEGGSFASFAVVARVGAAVASLGVLLSLITGTSRTLFAMATHRDMPAFLAVVHLRYRVPQRAQFVVGGLVALLTTLADVRTAIGFSSFAVLLYYAVANVSAWTLSASPWPRVVACVGLLGCLAVAATLPLVAVAGGACLVAAGGVAYLVTRWLRDRTTS